MNEGEVEIKAGLLMRQRSIKKNLICFRKQLQDNERAPLTVKGYITGLQSFYKTSDVELPSLPRTGKAIPLEKHKSIPTIEDIQAVLKICDTLERVIILVGVSSGLSSNEIIRLSAKDFKNGNHKNRL